MYDVALHRLPAGFCLDRACGVTGDDGASHHGVYDMALLTKVPGMTVFGRSSAQESLQVMLHEALACDGPAAIRWPKGQARLVDDHEVGTGLGALPVRVGVGDVCVIAVGKMVGNAGKAASLLAEDGVEVTIWDARVVKPLDPVMLADAARDRLVVTVEDGVADGGVGSLIAAEADGVLRRAGEAAVEILGVPLQFIPHGKPDRILANLGLDGEGIAGHIAAALTRTPD